MALRRAISVVLLVGGAALPAACNSLPELPPMQLPAEASALPISATEAYTRIARPAMSCWFGPSGRLAHTHIFNADAAPPSRGGAVEIVIHERAIDQPKPWGYKAFRISLKHSGDLTHIGIENLRMPDDVAREMRAEVLAWARGSMRCIGNAVPPPGAAAFSTSVTSSRPRSSATGPTTRN